ncbi:CBS domain-containing protein [Cellulomonas massiliensis]|uniref:CBS domain-containing protein n=1 Tax=Cellulomonas massiliensis TaxID=1465811 RepID=UPI0002EAC2AB|nr:CBS domain-containing protein [Cellulomonas massiliensis]
MPRTVADVMTADPVTLPLTATVREAAELMRERDIGDVVLVQDDGGCAIVTDRDLVVRVLAVGGSAHDPVGQVASTAATVEPSTPLEEAARLMAQDAVRRLPVVHDGRIVGVVSLGDLAVEVDPGSVLGDISSAPPSS